MPTIDNADLTKAAKEIRGLMKEWVNNALKIGAALARARLVFAERSAAKPIRRRGDHLPGWSQWLKAEVNLSADYASRMIRCHERLSGRPGAENLSVKVMKLLAQEQTPDEAIAEVIDLAKRRSVKPREAKEVVKKHLPKPAEANQKARDTGKPHLASDGNYYFGHTKEEAEAVEQQRTLIYGVRRAVKALSDVADEITPLQFLSKAHLHQLWNRDNERELENATRWLAELSEQWEKRYAQRTA